MRRSTVVHCLLLPALWLVLASCRDQGPEKVFRINVLPASDTLAPGSVVQLTADLLTEGGRALSGRVVTWLTSNPAVAQVSSSGLVTAVAPGTVTIEAKSEGRRGTTFIIVREPVAAIRFVPDAVIIDVHDGFVRPRLDLVDRFGNGVFDRLVTWQTSNPAVATVNAFGEIAPVSEGDAAVIATSEGLEATIQVHIRRVPVASLKIDPATTMVFESLPLQLRALVLRADGQMLFGRPVTWSSSDASILAVDSTGRLTPMRHGSAAISAASGGMNSAIDVTVIAGSAGVSSGGDHTCVISAAAAAWCWGANTLGQLGATAPDECGIDYWYYYYNETYPCARSPLRVETTQRFREVSAGEAHSCALTLAGQPWCWGNNAFGSLGVASTQPTGLFPTVVQTNVAFKTISAGANYTCGIDNQGEVYCWGFGPDGQLGFGDNVAVQPARVPTTTRFTSLSAGVHHTCAIAIDGSIWCWGANWTGQLGDGTLELSRTPIRVAGDLTAVRVSVGAEHTCALTAGNAVYCWGGNTDGQLGTGSTQMASIPQPVSGDTQWKDVSAGAKSSCAISQASRLYCWGSNSNGQLGQGGVGVVRVPAFITTSQLFVSVSINRTHACGRLTDGGVSCWGSSASGELGIGGVSHSASPARVTIPQ
jgi:alpha-tubulin suppressor-like RCC1 family protein